MTSKISAATIHSAVSLIAAGICGMYLLLQAHQYALTKSAMTPERVIKSALIPYKKTLNKHISRGDNKVIETIINQAWMTMPYKNAYESITIIGRGKIVYQSNAHPSSDLKITLQLNELMKNHAESPTEKNKMNLLVVNYNKPIEKAEAWMVMWNIISIIVIFLSIISLLARYYTKVYGGLKKATEALYNHPLCEKVPADRGGSEIVAEVIDAINQSLTAQTARFNNTHSNKKLNLEEATKSIEARDQQIEKQIEAVMLANKTTKRFLTLLSNTTKYYLMQANHVNLSVIEQVKGHEKLKAEVEIAHLDMKTNSDKLKLVVSNLTNFDDEKTQSIAINESTSRLVKTAIDETKMMLIQREKTHLNAYFDIAGDMPSSIKINLRNIQILIHSILDECIGYTSKEGIYFSVRTKNLEELQLLQITLIDSRRKLTPEQIDQAFEPFNQELSQENSLGINLYAAKLVTKEHNGRMSIHRKFRKETGNRISIELPIHKSDVGPRNPAITQKLKINRPVYVLDNGPLRRAITTKTLIAAGVMAQYHHRPQDIMPISGQDDTKAIVLLFPKSRSSTNEAIEYLLSTHADSIQRIYVFDIAQNNEIETEKVTYFHSFPYCAGDQNIIRLLKKYDSATQKIIALKKLLYIDSNASTTNQVRKMLTLQQPNWEVHFAPSLISAEAYFRDIKYDLIITEAQIDGDAAWEIALPVIASLNKETPMCIYSMLDIDDDAISNALGLTQNNINKMTSSNKTIEHFNKIMNATKKPVPLFCENYTLPTPEYVPITIQSDLEQLSQRISQLKKENNFNQIADNLIELLALTKDLKFKVCETLISSTIDAYNNTHCREEILLRKKTIECLVDAYLTWCSRN